MQLNSDKEKFEELKHGDIRKKIIAMTENSDIRRMVCKEGILLSKQSALAGMLTVTRVIGSMDSDEMKLKSCEEILKSVYEYDINVYKDYPDMKSEIEKYYSYGILSLISSLKDPNLMVDKLIEFEVLEKFLKFGYKVKNKGDIIQNNIEKILKYYEIDDITEKKEMLLRMKESNSKVFEQMDYRLLDSKFLNTFSEDEINLIISNNRGLVNKICNYNENQLKFVSTIIRNLERKDDFSEYFTTIIHNLDSYKELIANLDGESLSENKELKNIIQYKNIFDIKTIEDLNNFESIKNKKLKEIMDTEVKDPKGFCTPNVTESGTVIEKKNAVLLKMFGIDYDTAKRFLVEFQELITDDKSLQMMENIISLDHTYPTGMYETDKILRQIYLKMKEFSKLRHLYLIKLMLEKNILCNMKKCTMMCCLNQKMENLLEKKME